MNSIRDLIVERSIQELAEEHKEEKRGFGGYGTWLAGIRNHVFNRTGITVQLQELQNILIGLHQQKRIHLQNWVEGLVPGFRSWQEDWADFFSPSFRLLASGAQSDEK
jgi:hypothetical protein